MFEEEIPAVSLAGEEIRFIGPVRVEGKVSGGQKLLVSEGQVRAVVRRQCSRCLTDYEEEVVAPLEAQFAHVSRLASLSDEEREQVQPFEGNEIELRPAIEEALVLALPMKALCQPDCPGLCPQCGHDLKEGPCACPKPDERLTVLGSLFARQKG